MMLPFKFILALPVNQQAINVGITSFSCRPMSSLVMATSKGRRIDIDKIDKKMELPEKPKKPLTPYLLFTKQRRTEFLNESSKFNVPETTQKVAQEWKAINRTKYVDEYNRLHEEYAKKMEEYQESLTEKQKDYLKLKKDLKRQHNAFRDLKSFSRPPKQPRNQGVIFLIETLAKPEYQEMMKCRPTHKIFSEIYEIYRNLDSETKEKYIKLAEEDKNRFARELHEWYEAIQADASIRKGVREQADAFYSRFKDMYSKPVE